MTIKFPVTVLLIFASFSLFAQNTILWKITSSKTNKISYLLGTNHLLGNSFVDSFPVIVGKLQSADVLVTETQINRKYITDFYNSAPPSTGLSQTVSEEDIDFIKSIFKRSNVDVFRLPPGILYYTLQMYYPAYKCSNKIDSLRFDEYLQYLGKLKNKNLVYLEDDSLQLSIIKQGLTKNFTWKNFKEHFPALLKKYKTGNDDKDCLFMKQYLSFNLNYSFNNKCKDYDVEVEDRNNKWMQKLPALVNNNNCFIAVGLFHLYNECGIIEQLRKLGYIVEPLHMN